MNTIKIPVYKPLLVGKEHEYVKQCLDSSWISSKGEFVSRFEENFSQYINAHATTVANGTVALHLALLALGLGVGDEIIVPTFTYIASVNSIAYVGATPIFVDSLKDSWNLDPIEIRKKLTARTKAIMVVHIYGNPCAMDEIVTICKEHNLLLIEDAAEAFGSKYRNKYVGTFGDISTFSFFGNKTITTGEGGMVVAKDPKIIAKVCKLKSQSVSATKEYWHDEIGFNYRMTNVCAAIGVAQLEEADSIIQKKRLLTEWYKNALQNCQFSFQKEDDAIFNTYWMVSLVAANNAVRDGIREYLKQHGVETRPFFYPAHTMPVFKTDNSYPIAEELSKCGLNLPSYPGLTKEEVEYICVLIKTFIRDSVRLEQHEFCK